MIYLLGMPTYVVIGTSLFQIIFVTANITLLQSVQTQTVDFVLSWLAVIWGGYRRTNRRTLWHQITGRAIAWPFGADCADGIAQAGI